MNLRSSKYLTQKTTNCMNSDREPHQSQSTKQKSVTPKFYPTSIITSPPQFQLQNKNYQFIKKNQSSEVFNRDQQSNTYRFQRKVVKKSPISSIHNLVKQRSNLSGYFPLRQPQNFSLIINHKSTQNSLDRGCKSYSKDSTDDIKNAIELKKSQQNGPLPNLLTTELRKYLNKKEDQEVFQQSKDKKSKSRVKIVNGKYVKITEQNSSKKMSSNKLNNRLNQSQKLQINKNHELKKKNEKFQCYSQKRLDLNKKSQKSVRIQSTNRLQNKQKFQNKQNDKGIKRQKNVRSYSKVSALSEYNNNNFNKSNRCLSLNFPNKIENQFQKIKSNAQASFGKNNKHHFSEGPQIDHIMVSPSRKSHSNNARSILSKSNKSPLLDNNSKSLNLTKNFIENYQSSRKLASKKKKKQKSKSKSKKSLKKSLKLSSKNKQKSSKSLKNKSKLKSKSKSKSKSKNKKNTSKAKKSEKKSEKKQKKKNNLSQIRQWIKIIQSGNPVLIQMKKEVKQKSEKKEKKSKSKKKSSTSNKIKKNAQKLMIARKNIKQRSKIMEKINEINKSYKNLNDQKKYDKDELFNQNNNMFTIPQMTSEPQICNILQSYSPIESIHPNDYQIQSKSCLTKQQAQSGLSNMIHNPYNQINTEYTLQMGQNSILKTDSSHATLKVDNYQLNEDRYNPYPNFQNQIVQLKGSDQSSSIFNSSIDKGGPQQINNPYIINQQNLFDQNQAQLRQKQEVLVNLQNNDFNKNNEEQKQIQKSYSQIVSHRTLRSRGDHSTLSLSNREQGIQISKIKKMKKKSQSLKKKKSSKSKSQKKSRSSKNRLLKIISQNYLIGSQDNIMQSPYVVSTFRGGQTQTIPQNIEAQTNYFQPCQPPNDGQGLYGTEARNINNISQKSGSQMHEQNSNQRQLNYSYSREGNRFFKGKDETMINSEIKSQKKFQQSGEILVNQYKLLQKYKNQQLLQQQIELQEKKEKKEKLKIQLHVEALDQMKQINVRQENRFQILKEQMKESLLEIKNTKARLDNGTQFSSIENQTTKRNFSSNSVSEKSEGLKNKKKFKRSFKNYVEKFTDRIDLQIEQKYEIEINKYKDRRLKLQILKNRAQKVPEYKEVKVQLDQQQDNIQQCLNADIQEDFNQETYKSIDDKIKEKYYELNQLKSIKYQQKLIENTEQQLNQLNQQNIYSIIDQGYDSKEKKIKKSQTDLKKQKLIESLLNSARKSLKNPSQRSKNRNSSKNCKNQMSFSKLSQNDSSKHLFNNKKDENHKKSQKELKYDIKSQNIYSQAINSNNNDTQKEYAYSMTRNGGQFNLTTGERQSRKSSQIIKNKRKSHIDSLNLQESIKRSASNSKINNQLSKSQTSIQSSHKQKKSQSHLRSISSKKKSSKSRKQRNEKPLQKEKKIKIQKSNSKKRQKSIKKPKTGFQSFQTDVMNSKNSTIVHQCKASDAASTKPQYVAQTDDDYQLPKVQLNNNNFRQYNHLIEFYRSREPLNIQDQEKKLRFEIGDRTRQPYQNELVSMKGSCSHASARSGMPFNIKTPYGMTGEKYQCSMSQIQNDSQKQQTIKPNENKSYENQNNNMMHQAQNNFQKQKVNSILKNSSAQIGLNSQASNLSLSYLEDVPMSQFIGTNGSQSQMTQNQMQKLKQKLCPQSASEFSQDSDSDFELGFAPQAWKIKKIQKEQV